MSSFTAMKGRLWDWPRSMCVMKIFSNFIALPPMGLGAGLAAKPCI